MHLSTFSSAIRSSSFSLLCSIPVLGYDSISMTIPNANGPAWDLALAALQNPHTPPETLARARNTLKVRRYRARQRGEAVPRNGYVAPLTKVGRPAGRKETRPRIKKKGNKKKNGPGCAPGPCCGHLPYSSSRTPDHNPEPESGSLGDQP